MKSEEIRTKFLTFFKERGHAVVPSSSLIPDDPSVLLTTAGMQQFKKYYTGETDPMQDFGSLNTVSIQKSFRTSDIDEVGDESHLTFFEMLGNFSFGYKPGEPGSPRGGYFKEDAINYAFDFITKEMGLTISYVTIFSPEGGSASGGKGGSPLVSKDTESEEIWKSLGITDIREEGMEDVFWGPTGGSGPCGPTTELYCRNTAGQDVEIWNIVFNEFFCSGSREQLLAGTATLAPLEKKGIDTGMGLERLAMISQNKKNIFETDLFEPYISFVPQEIEERKKRVIVDHLRAAIFLISDGVQSSNKGTGYILRNLLRRILVYENIYKNSLKIEDATFIWDIMTGIIQDYGYFYDKLNKNEITIKTEVENESKKFKKTLALGIEEFKKRLNKQGILTTKDVFDLHQTFGLRKEQSVETINEIISIMGDSVKHGVGKPIEFNEEEFNRLMRRHQELSRAGQEKKFGGHGLLLDTGELKAADETELKIVTRLHTATHLLQAALRKVLGPEVGQQGSDITAERTRFDFSFPRKLTPEEIKQVEDTVNEAIARDYTVEFKEMPYEEAVTSGALYFFRQKYPAVVKVYSVFDPKTDEMFSREFCGGPHVTHTGEIGHIKITKEEASSAGIRRIRASLINK